MSELQEEIRAALEANDAEALLAICEREGVDPDWFILRLEHQVALLKRRSFRVLEGDSSPLGGEGRGKTATPLPDRKGGKQ